PLGDRVLERKRLVGADVLRSVRRHVQRDTQVRVVGANLLRRDQLSESRDGFKALVGAANLLYVELPQEALRLLTGVLGDGVDEEHLPLPLLGLPSSAHDDACFHRAVVEEAGAKSEDTLEDVGLKQLAPHRALLIAKEDAVGEQDRAPS